MLILGNTIRLDAEEKEMMGIEAGCRIEPTTVADFNAWVDEIKYPDPNPEQRLMNALFDTMKIVDGVQENAIKRVLVGNAD